MKKIIGVGVMMVVFGAFTAGCQGQLPAGVCEVTVPDSFPAGDTVTAPYACKDTTGNF